MAREQNHNGRLSLEDLQGAVIYKQWLLSSLALHLNPISTTRREQIFKVHKLMTKSIINQPTDTSKSSSKLALASLSKQLTQCTKIDSQVAVQTFNQICLMQLLRLNFLQTQTPGHARLITPNYHHRVLLLCLNDPRNLNQFFYFSLFFSAQCFRRQRWL